MFVEMQTNLGPLPPFFACENDATQRTAGTEIDMETDVQNEGSWRFRAVSNDLYGISIGTKSRVNINLSQHGVCLLTDSIRVLGVHYFPQIHPEL